MGPISVSSVVSSEARRRVAFPLERRLVLDTLRLGHRQPMMHGLLEVDVTRARTLLRELRQRTAEGLSFTAFVLACLGRAVTTHPEVHALRDWLGRSVLYEDVDVTTMIEVEVDGRPFALAHVVRAVNRRSPREIHDEIRSIQRGGPDWVTPRTRAAFKVFLRLPGGLRRLVLRGLLRFPRLAKRHVGTVLLTAVGMFGGGPGWGWSAPGIHGLSIVVGGIATRAAADQDQHGSPGPREILCLTVSADHNRVDGAPMARFVRDLRTRLEAADGLC